jgi:hypothetical protein
LYYGRKVADTAAGDQCRRKPREIVHRKVRQE